MRKFLALFLALTLTGCAAAPVRDRAVTASAWADDDAAYVYFVAGGDMDGDLYRADKATLTVESLDVRGASVYVYDDTLYYGVFKNSFAIPGGIWQYGVGHISKGGGELFCVDELYVQSFGYMAGGLYARDSGERLDAGGRFPVYASDRRTAYTMRGESTGTRRDYAYTCTLDYGGQTVEIHTFTNGMAPALNEGFHLYDGAVYHSFERGGVTRVELSTGAKTVLTEADEIIAVAHGKLYLLRGGALVIHTLDSGAEAEYPLEGGRPFVDSYEDRVYLIDTAAQTVTLLLEKEA